MNIYKSVFGFTLKHLPVVNPIPKEACEEVRLFFKNNPKRRICRIEFANSIVGLTRKDVAEPILSNKNRKRISKFMSKEIAEADSGMLINDEVRKCFGKNRGGRNGRR